MNQPVARPHKSFVLSILNGPDKGAQFKISGFTLTIGRGRDNDIQVKGDSQISRQHLRIFIRNGEIYIESLNEKNPLFINKKPIEKAIIESGVQFVAGRTQFEIREADKSLSVLSNSIGPHTPPHPSPKLKKRKPASLFIYGIVGVVVILFLFTSKKKEVVEEPMLRTEESVDKDIDSQRKIMESLKKKNMKSGKLTSKFKRAQVGYVKGFRDYRQGQYERAIQNFQECLSIYPAHILCRRYLTLAQKRFNEIVQYHMVAGKKYLDKKQYQSCMTSFKNVMVMVQDPNDKVFIEAQSNLELCTYHYKDRF